MEREAFLIPVLKNADPITDRAAMIAAFLRSAQSASASFLEMGRLRFDIESTLADDEEIYTVLQAAGVKKSDISNAKYSRDAWSLVVSGKATEKEFLQLSFHDCRAVSRLLNHPAPMEVVSAGAEAGLDVEATVALAKWDVRGNEMRSLARKCAERGLTHSTIARGAECGILPDSEASRCETIGSRAGVVGPGAPVNAILRWSTRIGGTQAIAKMPIKDVRMLGEIFMPLTVILGAIAARLRSQKIADGSDVPSSKR